MSFEPQLCDLLGREPELVKVLRYVIPTRGDTFQPGDRAFVIRVEPDRLGIGVKTDAGNYVSLHPSEYEVLCWRDPPETPPAESPVPTSHSEVCS